MKCWRDSYVAVSKGSELSKSVEPRVKQEVEHQQADCNTRDHHLEDTQEQHLVVSNHIAAD